ncbi:DUF4190 domain-containing protein, partial [Microcella alkalica]
GMPALRPGPTDAAPPAPPARAARLNPLAVLALLLGILLSPLAALFGHLAAGQITRSHGAERGAVLAWVAIGLGWLWLLLLVIIAAAVWVALAS